MDWYLWVVVIWWVLNGLLYVGMIGKTMEFTVGSAVAAMVLYPALIIGLLVTR